MCQSSSMCQSSLVGSIITTARRYPDTAALVWDHREMSYRELTQLAWRARERITALDLAGGEPIGILAAKSPEAVALVFGALLAQRAFLLPAPDHPPSLLRRLLTQAGCRYVLSPGETSRIPDTEPGQIPGDISFMLTTSGSTGPPKIVPLPAAAVGRFLGWAAGAFEIGPGRRVLNYAPLSFDLCLLDIWTTLARGGTAVLIDPRYALRGDILAGVLAHRQVHVVQSVPMLFSLLAGAGRPVFPSVQHVMFTGEAIPPRALAALPELFPRAQLYNLYGCTETNDSFLHEVDSAAAQHSPVPLGHPIPGVRALIVAEDGSVVPGPGSGQLWVSTPFQASGYLSVPYETSETSRFTPHPAGLPGLADPAGSCWFRTGDLVRRDPDGTLFLTGRNDLRVKVRGVGVDLGGVERALLGHSQVLSAAVLPVSDPVAGALLHAVVQRMPGSSLHSLALRQHCAGVLPRGAIPHVMRVVDHELPRTPTGKLDRTALARTYLMPHRKGA